MNGHPNMGDPGRSNNFIMFSSNVSADEENYETIKCVIVGDAGVGKSCLLSSFVNNSIPNEYTHTVFDNFRRNVEIENNQIISLGLWDTSGLDDYDRLRPLAYPETHVFIMCYSVINPTSFHNVENKWFLEIKEHSPETPIILVGTKLDLRNDRRTIDELRNVNGENPIPTRDGERLSKKLNAQGFLECSAMNQFGVKEVFDKAIREVLFPSSKPDSKQGLFENLNRRNDKKFMKKRNQLLKESDGHGSSVDEDEEEKERFDYVVSEMGDLTIPLGQGSSTIGICRSLLLLSDIEIEEAVKRLSKYKSPLNVSPEQIFRILLLDDENVDIQKKEDVKDYFLFMKDLLIRSENSTNTLLSETLFFLFKQVEYLCRNSFKLYSETFKDFVMCYENESIKSWFRDDVGDDDDENNSNIIKKDQIIDKNSYSFDHSYSLFLFQMMMKEVNRFGESSILQALRNMKKKTRKIMKKDDDSASDSSDSSVYETLRKSRMKEIGDAISERLIIHLQKSYWYVGEIFEKTNYDQTDDGDGGILLMFCDHPDFKRDSLSIDHPRKNFKVSSSSSNDNNNNNNMNTWNNNSYVSFIFDKNDVEIPWFLDEKRDDYLDDHRMRLYQILYSEKYRSCRNLVLRTRDGGKFEVNKEILIWKSNLFYRMMHFKGQEFYDIQEKGEVMVEDLDSTAMELYLELIFLDGSPSHSYYSRLKTFIEYSRLKREIEIEKRKELKSRKRQLMRKSIEETEGEEEEKDDDDDDDEEEEEEGDKMSAKDDYDGKMIKITVVGDRGTGRNSLLITFTTNQFPEDYVSVFDVLDATHDVNNISYNISLLSTRGQEEYDEIRQMSYEDVDVFLCCFSLDDPTSHHNVKNKWIPEIRQHSEKNPIVIVGCKSDLVNDEEINESRRITEQSILRKNNNQRLVYCSSKNHHNVSKVFDIVIQSFLDFERIKKDEETKKYNEMIKTNKLKYQNGELSDSDDEDEEEKNIYISIDSDFEDEMDVAESINSSKNSSSRNVGGDDERGDDINRYVVEKIRKRDLLSFRSEYLNIWFRVFCFLEKYQENDIYVRSDRYNNRTEYLLSHFFDEDFCGSSDSDDDNYNDRSRAVLISGSGSNTRREVFNREVALKMFEEMMIKIGHTFNEFVVKRIHQRFFKDSDCEMKEKDLRSLVRQSKLEKEKLEWKMKYLELKFETDEMLSKIENFVHTEDYQELGKEKEEEEEKVNDYNSEKILKIMEEMKKMVEKKKRKRREEKVNEALHKKRKGYFEVLKISLDEMKKRKLMKEKKKRGQKK